MKTLTVVALAIALVTQTAQAGGIQQTDFKWDDPSGKQHTTMMAIGSVAMCGWLHMFTQTNPKTGKPYVTRKKAILSTAATGLGLGLAKELTDARRGGTGFSMNDMYHNGAGLLLGLTPYILTYRF